MTFRIKSFCPFPAIQDAILLFKIDNVLFNETSRVMLEFKNISKSFSEIEVLHQVSFEIDEGKIVALVGENGAGKSTLMKILSGIISDYQGEIYLQGNRVKFNSPKEAERAGISIIHQELNLIPDLSAAENIFLGREPLSRLGFVDFRRLYQKADAILKEFDFPDSSRIPIRQLSIGWQQMIEIARSLSIESRVVIMDEPTSALSESEIKILFEKIRLLKRKHKTVIFISHRLKEIYEIADEIIVLRDGSFAGKFPVAEVTRKKLITLMSGRTPGEITKKSYRKRNQDNNKRYEILRIDNLTVFDRKRTILSGVQFSLQEGEILGIAGLLGAGRTELLKFIYGEFTAEFSGSLTYKGEIYRPVSASHSLRLGIAYLSENRKSEGIFAALEVMKNSSISILNRLTQFGFLDFRQEKQTASAKLTELNTRLESLEQKIITLSGGNQQKVLLSRVLLIQPNLLLLDEPTRGIDVSAKQEIYDLIRQLSSDGIGIMVTSSEIPELLGLCHRILVLSHGTQTALVEAEKTDSKEILGFAFKVL
jgi:ribose transport system ATP-binding protein